MPTHRVKNPIKTVLEVDLLVRRAVNRSWEVQSNLLPPVTGGYREAGPEVRRSNVQDEVKKQITRLVERALKDMDEDVQDYNVCEYRPG